MPISRREFEKAELDPSLLIEEFLRSKADYAFTLRELMDELASRYTLKELMSGLISKGAEFTEEGLQKTLNSLEERGRIESTTIGHMVYYTYRETIGF